MTNSYSSWLEMAQVISDCLMHKQSIPEKVNLADVLMVADKNNLLYAVGLLLTDKRPFPQPYESKMQKEEIRSEGTKRLLDMLRPEFEKQDLPLFAMKTFLPFSYVDSNIDFFCIPTEKKTLYISTLKRLGFEWFKNLADIREPLKRTFIHRDKSLGLPAYHLHTAVSWNGVHYLNLPETWDARRRYSSKWPSLYIPCPTDELVIMMAHALTENKYITLHEIIYLNLLCQSEIDWQRALRTVSDFNWENGFLEMLSLYKGVGKSLGFDFLMPHIDPKILANTSIQLPFLLPFSATFQMSMHKLRQDIISRNLKAIPRQLFSYTLVDGFWMMRKARKKCSLKAHS